MEGVTYPCLTDAVPVKMTSAFTAADSVSPSAGVVSLGSRKSLSLRLLLADPHRLLIESLAATLTQRGVDVVAVATSPREVFAKVAEHRPDVCLLSTHFPWCSGLGVLRVISRRHPGIGVVMFSPGSDPELTRAAFRSGAAAVVSKDRHISDIERVLSRVGQRERAFDDGLLRVAAREFRVSGTGNGHRPVRLTSREKEVLRHIVEGERTQQIARSLGISEATVRTHVQNVFSKLGVHSRLEATIVAAQAGVPGWDVPGMSARRAAGGR
jgi:two-component system nitrate/nitrite response regulator NarL